MSGNSGSVQALGRLSDREHKIVSLYYGFERESSMTLEEVGQEIGLTRERIRQIRDGALVKLRRSPKQLVSSLKQEWELS